MKFIKTDGGRAEAGYKGSTGDCVTRAIAVATDTDYQEVYDGLFQTAKDYLAKKNNKFSKALKKGGCSPRNGVYQPISIAYLKMLGWKKVSSWDKETGYKVLDGKAFKKGTFICKTRKHFTVVKDGVLYDSYDCQMTSEIRDEYGDVVAESKVRTVFHYYVKS